MKIKILALLAFVPLLALSSCKVEVTNDKNNSSLVTKTVDAKDFDKICIAAPADVTYKQSDTYRVTMRARQKTLDRMIVGVKGSTLNIKRAKQSGYIIFNSDDDIDITVEAPELKDVKIAGSGSFDCHGTMKAKAMSLSIAGSGEIEIADIQAKEVKASIAGSGDIEAGLTRVDKISVDIAGSGDVEMDLHQCGNLKTSIAGSGDIELRGDVRTFEQHVSGSGDINMKKLRVLGE